MLCLVVAPNLSFGQTVSDAPELKQSGTVEIEQVQVAFLYSGNLGGGRLHYRGKIYEFTPEPPMSSSGTQSGDSFLGKPATVWRKKHGLSSMAG